MMQKVGGLRTQVHVISTIAALSRGGWTSLDVRREVLVPLDCVGMVLKTEHEHNIEWR